MWMSKQLNMSFGEDLDIILLSRSKFRNCLPQTPNWKGVLHPIWWKVSLWTPTFSQTPSAFSKTEADLVMFNAVVSACAGATQWRRALEVLFRYMHLEVTYVCRVGWAKWWAFFVGEYTQIGRRIAGFGSRLICPDGWMFVNGSDMIYFIPYPCTRCIWSKPRTLTFPESQPRTRNKGLNAASNREIWCR